MEPSSSRSAALQVFHAVAEPGAATSSSNDFAHRPAPAAGRFDVEFAHLCDQQRNHEAPAPGSPPAPLPVMMTRLAISRETPCPFQPICQRIEKVGDDQPDEEGQQDLAEHSHEQQPGGASSPSQTRAWRSLLIGRGPLAMLCLRTCVRHGDHAPAPVNARQRLAGFVAKGNADTQPGSAPRLLPTVWTASFSPCGSTGNHHPRTQ